jgi:hypothetical protein
MTATLRPMTSANLRKGHAEGHRGSRGSFSFVERSCADGELREEMQTCVVGTPQEYYGERWKMKGTVA